MNAQLLFLLLLLLKERIIWWRLTAAAFLGGTGAVLVLITGMRFGIGYVLCVLALDAGMFVICAGLGTYHKHAFRRLAAGIIYLHGLEFAYGKLAECAGRLMGERVAGAAAAVTIAGIAAFLALCRSFSDRRPVYQVKLTENGEEIVVKALFDTGNLLSDPLSGKPVSVMEDTGEIRKWMKKYPQKYRVIPYRSVGNEHGILEGIVVDELLIQRDEEQVIQRGTIVAVYEGKLSKNGDFRMILNHSLISV